MRPDQFTEISLEQLSAVSLLRRIDTKFILHKKGLDALLSDLVSGYSILSIGGAHETVYSTTYFDTPDRILFRDHLHGRLGRYKIRTRDYLGQNLRYNEIKFKDNRRTTHKYRIRTAHEPIDSITPGFAALITKQTPLPPEILRPTLQVGYTRMTFSDTQFQERLTLDVNLNFTGTSECHRLDNIVIAELKQGRANNSAGRKILMNHARPLSFSKYCIGLCLAEHPPRINRFKPTLRTLEGISAQ